MFDTIQYIRILELPPMRVAAIHCTSASPEEDTLNAVAAFEEQHQLMLRKSDVRHFGYSPKTKEHKSVDTDSFVRMISIPGEIEVTKPFDECRFPGGLYAAYTVPISFFDKISELRSMIQRMDGYELVSGSEYDYLEEYLNGWLLSKEHSGRFFSEAQVDLLVHIKKHT